MKPKSKVLLYSRPAYGSFTLFSCPINEIKVKKQMRIDEMIWRILEKYDEYNIDFNRSKISSTSKISKISSCKILINKKNKFFLYYFFQCYEMINLLPMSQNVQ